ncbi:hypothetical protein BGZ95_006948, partial [Linnemannia exigua]
YLRHQRSALTKPESKIRIDIQGSIFPTIRHAYSRSSSLDAAHKLVLKCIEQLGRREDSVLYFDGNLAKEKLEMHQQRRSAREKALKDANKEVDEFDGRVRNGLKIRKQHFINIYKSLSKAFEWDPEARESLIAYLEQEGWSVADVKIAEDSKKGDLVISGDSDLAIHPNVTMIWRPVSGGRFLEYKMEDVLEALGGISRTQLTALGIVSHNDYNKNVYGVGCASNFNIIKPLSGMDVPGMVADYLADSQVILKNRDKLNFDNSIKVFARGQHETMSRSERDPEALTIDQIKIKFYNVQQRYEQRKRDDAEARNSAKSALPGDRVYRHKAGQQFNRYRVIDQPPPQEKQDCINKDRITAGAASSQQNTDSTSACHERPQMMKQYKLKPWKSKTENPENISTTPISDISEEPKAPR